MRFYYTGASEDGAVQPIARQSIGGYVSSSVVQNDVLNEIFSNISLNTEKNNQYRLLALKNILSSDVENVIAKFYINDEAIAEFEVAFVYPTKDDCDKDIFEQVSTQYSKPFTGEFVPVTDGMALSLGDLAAAGVIGIWIVRKYDTASNPTKTCEELEDDYTNEAVIEKEDNLDIEITWGVPESVSASVSMSASTSA